MKLILAVLQDKDSEIVSQALVSSDFRVTRIASNGGFFRRGSATFFIGVDDSRVEEAIQVIRNCCPQPSEPGMKRASLFVLNVARFDQV
jgi:uncharacterized protein YaaQ